MSRGVDRIPNDGIRREESEHGVEVARRHRGRVACEDGADVPRGETLRGVYGA